MRVLLKYVLFVSVNGVTNRKIITTDWTDRLDGAVRGTVELRVGVVGRSLGDMASMRFRPGGFFSPPR